jgi:cystathionine gamma-synthase
MTGHAEVARPDTLAVVAGRPPRRPGAPVSPGVQLSSTFVGAGVTPPGQAVYGRVHNDTWVALEQAIGALEGVPEGCLVFSSGMAAAAAVIEIIDGGRLVVPDAAYNTVLELFEVLAGRGRLSLTRVDIADTAAVLEAMQGGSEGAAAWLWLESPTNPLLAVADLAALVAGARRLGTRVAVDNTFATPMLANPLMVGADVVVHSVTKFLSGHSDLLLGAVVTADPVLHTELAGVRRLQGAVAGPMEAWLALRGLRTLAVRLDRAQESAGVLAHRLAAHPALSRVRYPGLPADPGHQRACEQLRGFGAMIAIELRGGPAAADALCDAVRLWRPATSLGGVESLLERRRRQPNEPHTVPENLVRLSVGIENVEDLWNDLEQALRRLPS